MKMASAQEVEAHFAQYLDQCKDEPVVVTRDDHAVAVLMPVVEGEDLDSLVLAHSPRFRRLLEDSEQRIQETGGITHEELCARLGVAP